MSTKSREPGEAFKRQISDFAPVRKKRPWRDDDVTPSSAPADTILINDSRLGASSVLEKNSAIAEFAIAKNTIDETATRKETMAGTAIANITIAVPAIDGAVNNKPRENSAIAEIAIDADGASKETMADFAIANVAIDDAGNKLAIANSAIAATSSKNEKNPKQKLNADSRKNKIESAIAKFAKDGTRIESDSYLESKTSFSSQSLVFEKVVPKLENPTASLIYLYLYNLKIQSQESSITLSLGSLAEKLGLAKRTVQDAIKKLEDAGFLKHTNAGRTVTSSFIVVSPESN